MTPLSEDPRQLPLSGTTIIEGDCVAEMRAIRFIGIEQDPTYADVARARMAQDNLFGEVA